MHLSRHSKFPSPHVLVATLGLLLAYSPTSATVPGSPEQIAVDHLRDQAVELGVTATDLEDLAVTDRTLSSHNGLTHVYLQQRLLDLDVMGGHASVAVTGDGAVAHVGNRLLADLAGRVSPTGAALSAAEAVERAAVELDLGRPRDLAILDESFDTDRRTVFDSAGIALEPIAARLVYQPIEGGELRLAWDVRIYQRDATHYWSVRVDAGNGSLLDVDDWVDHDEYRVYPVPIESPIHTTPLPPADARVLEIDPHLDGAGSPFAWHDTDGSAGAEFTIHRGNNVHAYDDIDANNSPPAVEPDCGANLSCDFPVDLTMDPLVYTDAAVANLFYWNNIVHDVLWQYGFDEVSGNFQENNYGNGGAGSDSVNAEAQDGGGNCNANFATPPDGSNPRMQMYLCNLISPRRDGDFDNLVIVHEYGHGVSNRLTGGPGNVGCLNNSEQAGEGWSDWYGLMLTQQAGHTETLARGVGEYLFGFGIRSAPYTTDMAVNPFTYGDLPGMAVPHGVGFVFATMIWDLNWALINEHGFNSNFYDDWTTGGNNLALQLVTDGLKLQACSPGFVDSRDAILAADQALTGGANECLIWEVFARRGLGFSADQGSPFNSNDGTEAFDTPPNCGEIFSDGFESGDTSSWSTTVPMP